MFKGTCRHCARPIVSDHGGPGALWTGPAVLPSGKADWTCTQHNSTRWPSAHGPHQPVFYPDERTAAIERILRKEPV